MLDIHLEVLKHRHVNKTKINAKTILVLSTHHKTTNQKIDISIQLLLNIDKIQKF